VIELYWLLSIIVSCDKNYSTSLEYMNAISLCFTFCNQSRCVEWIIDTEAEFSCYKQCQRTETAKRSGGLFLALVSGKKVSAAFSLVSGCSGSLRLVLPCPDTWYYSSPMPACAVSLCMTAPCLKLHEIHVWWACLALVISFRGQESSHLL
jgi:hypothetical protein